MATSLDSFRLTLRLAWDFVNGLDLSDVTDEKTLDWNDSLTNGTGTDQGNMMWHDERTLATTSEDLDLAGSLVNAFGRTITFTKIKGLFVKNTSTTTGQNVLVGGAAANQFVNWVSDASDEVVVGPNGCLALWSPMDGYAVTAATGDILRIETDANITYRIVLVGVGTAA